MHEKVPPSTQEQRLAALGVEQTVIGLIKNDTLALRRSGFEDTYLSFGDRGTLGYLESGNYQKQLEAVITGHPSMLTMKVAKKGFRGRTKVKEKPSKPVVIAEEIVRYARDLLAQGVSTVNIVDFAAGPAHTMREAASLMPEEIRAGRVNITATNINAVPSQELVQTLREIHETSQLSSPELIPLATGSMTFKRADILELEEDMHRRPIDLLFINNVFPFTKTYNDALLKIAASLLHPQRGTALLGLSNFLNDPFPSWVEDRQDFQDKLLRKGIWALDAKGFHEVDSFTDERIFVDPDRYVDSSRVPVFRIFQADQAPRFPLFAVSK